MWVSDEYVKIQMLILYFILNFLRPTEKKEEAPLDFFLDVVKANTHKELISPQILIPICVYIYIYIYYIYIYNYIIIMRVR